MDKFVFYTDNLTSSVEKKNDKEQYFVEGYASTPDLDLVNDIVTPEAMQEMVAQIKGRSIKVDVEHESWSTGGSPNIVPIGKIVDAKVDTKGLWIKAQLNSGVSRFSEVWSSVQDGFLDAFSIAFNNVTGSIRTSATGIKTRIITGLNLLNIALTGNPANPNACFTNVVAKSRDFAVIEGDVMSDDTIPAPEPVPVPEPAPPAPSVEEFNGLKEEVKSLSSLNASYKEQYDALAVRLKSLEDEMSKPVLKNLAPVLPPVTTAAKSVGPLDFFNKR